MAKTLLITGSGSLLNGWNPVLNALKEFYDPILSASEKFDLANLIFANYVHQLRWAWALKEEDSKKTFDKLEKLHSRLKERLADCLKEAEKVESIALRPELYKIKEKFLSDIVIVITTNWDKLIDKFAKENGYECLHLHGDRDDPKLLLLPSELHEEEYYKGKYNEYIGKFMQFFKNIDNLVLYGISLSPLDAELGILINEGFQNEKVLKQMIIIDKTPKVVFEKLQFILRDLWQKDDWNRMNISLLLPEQL